ncbi:MAG: hypothetical protein HQK53_05875 [Oligoflexia bacterium]|nr:hypothetical protein [Oligoflexia bacterium]
MAAISNILTILASILPQGKFTDDDVEQMKGTYDELSGRLQKIYGYGKERAEKELDKFVNKNKFQ